jgi:hypothetical protein
MCGALPAAKNFHEHARLAPSYPARVTLDDTVESPRDDSLPPRRWSRSMQRRSAGAPLTLHHPPIGEVALGRVL